MITQNELKKLVSYSENKGALIWKSRPRELFKSGRDCNAWNSRLSGEKVGAKSQGYLNTRIQGIDYGVHRLIWLYVNGSLPKNQIDHINHNRSDNRIQNLREVTQQQNLMNLSKSPRNTSGHTGVHWFKRDSVWVVSIMFKGKAIYGGRFSFLEDAVNKRKKMELQYGFHVNHGETLL